MRRRRIKLGLYGLSIPAIIQLCRFIIESLTGNADFPTPVPDLAVLTTAVDELEQAYEDATDGGKTLKAIQRSKKDTVFNLFRTERDHVNQAGDGDEVILLTSGFPLADLPSPIGDLGIAENVRTLTMAKPGVVQVECNSLRGASSYEVRYQPISTETPDVLEDNWQSWPASTAKKQEVTGLKSASYYWFEMRGIGANGPGPWGGPAKGLAA